MEVHGICKRTVYDWARPGEVKRIVVNKHSYAYSGKMPCTGNLKCIYCGKIKRD